MHGGALARVYLYHRMTRGSSSLVEIDFFITDRSSYARIFFLLASDSMDEKNIYHSCYSLGQSCAATAVVPEQKRMQERTRWLVDDALQRSWSLLNTIEYYIGATEALESARETLLSLALRQRETYLVRLSCSAESTTEALSLALHSVARVFHLALRVGSIPTLHLKTFENLFWTRTWREN